MKNEHMPGTLQKKGIYTFAKMASCWLQYVAGGGQDSVLGQWMVLVHIFNFYLLQNYSH
jgi:hypothetical protein